MGIFRNKLIAAAAVAGFALTATAAAAQDRSAPADAGIAAITDCEGGVQEASLVRTDNADVEIGEADFFSPVPNTLRTFTTPAGDTDQVRVTFMAEAALFGSPFDNTGAVDALGVEIRLDGTPLPAAGDLGFTTTVHHANATMVCRRVGAGTHTVEVYWRVIDKGTDQTLSGRLDDWALDIEINN